MSVNKSIIVDKNRRVGKIPLKETIKCVVLIYFIFTIMIFKDFFSRFYFYLVCKNISSIGIFTWYVKSIVHFQHTCWWLYKQSWINSFVGGDTDFINTVMWLSFHSKPDWYEPSMSILFTQSKEIEHKSLNPCCLSF